MSSLSLQCRSVLVGLLPWLFAGGAFAQCYQVTAEGSEPIQVRLEFVRPAPLSLPGQRQSTTTPWIKSTLSMGGKNYIAEAGGMIVSPIGGIVSSVIGNTDSGATGWSVSLFTYSKYWNTGETLPIDPPPISQWEDAYIGLMQTSGDSKGYKISSISSCSARCKINSETGALLPKNRQRTKIGVGELIFLSIGKTAKWVIAGAGKLETLSGLAEDTKATLTAGDREGITTITATTADSSCELEFEVIEPSEVRMKSTHLIYHHKGRPDSGFDADVYIGPADVSFLGISIKENAATFVGTGGLSDLTNKRDEPKAVFTGLSGWLEGYGTKLNIVDHIYSGDPCTPAPFQPGELLLDIPWLFRVGDGLPKEFTVVHYRGTIESDGVTLTSSKAGAKETILVNSKTSGNHYSKFRNLNACKKLS